MTLRILRAHDRKIGHVPHNPSTVGNEVWFSVQIPLIAVAAIGR